MRTLWSFLALAVYQHERLSLPTKQHWGGSHDDAYPRSPSLCQWSTGYVPHGSQCGSTCTSLACMLGSCSIAVPMCMVVSHLPRSGCDAIGGLGWQENRKSEGVACRGWERRGGKAPGVARRGRNRVYPQRAATPHFLGKRFDGLSGVVCHEMWGLVCHACGLCPFEKSPTATAFKPSR